MWVNDQVYVPAALTPGERYWIDPRDNVHIVKKVNMSCLCWELNPDSSDHFLVLTGPLIKPSRLMKIPVKV
jgi:hypothetical protein